MKKTIIINFLEKNFQKYSEMSFNDIAEAIKINLGANINDIYDLKREILYKIVELEDCKC